MSELPVERDDVVYKSDDSDHVSVQRGGPYFSNCSVSDFNEMTFCSIEKFHSSKSCSFTAAHRDEIRS